jgi:hypothetical protein
MDVLQVTKDEKLVDSAVRKMVSGTDVLGRLGQTDMSCPYHPTIDVFVGSYFGPFREARHYIVSHLY